ncbi:MAG: hypothetical protein V1899_13025 [Planctomycetota bacterium]
MKINAYAIDDFSADLRSDMTVDDMRNNPELLKRVYQFTSLLYNQADKKLYCGVTNFDSDIFHTFDPVKKKFRSLGYQKRFKPATQFDIKIHRSLELDKATKSIISISSGLHDPSEYLDAPGSHLFRYCWETDTYEDLGRPIDHEYTQTITFDPSRQMVYGFTLTYFSFYAFDLRTRRTIFHTRPQSITHVSAVDDSGCIWSTWHHIKHWLFKYNPATNACTYFKYGFPEKPTSLMYAGAGPIDRMINIGDGFLYIALETGSLYKLDPGTAQVEFLGRGAPITRLPGLIKGIDKDTLLCVTGDLNVTYLMEYHLKKRSFTTLCEVKNKKSQCFRPHDIAVVGSTIYIAETDNPKGGCRLWEVEM